MQDLSAASILSLFGFDIIQLHLLLSKRRKTDSFEPVSACTQWIGLGCILSLGIQIYGTAILEHYD